MKLSGLLLLSTVTQVVAQDLSKKIADLDKDIDCVLNAVESGITGNALYRCEVKLYDICDRISKKHFENGGILDITAAPDTDMVAVLSGDMSGQQQIKTWNGIKWKKYNMRDVTKISTTPAGTPTAIIRQGYVIKLEDQENRRWSRLPGGCTKDIDVGKGQNISVFKLGCY